MEKYKSKIFPKIEKIVKDKESDKETMEKLEKNIVNDTNMLKRLDPDNPIIQHFTFSFEQHKKQISEIKSKKYPSIDDLVKEFAEKTKNWKILQEFAKNTNNPTVYWKAVMKKRQQRMKKHKLKPLGEQGWNNFSNLKPVKALNTNFGIGRK